ncbi:MAG: Rrf2 family transcriptional regulator [Bacillota bacterium]
MRISTKGRYALRLMLDLALNQANEHAPIKDIATRQEISAKYLEQIIPLLAKAGYVRSIRGSFGGYVLCKPPEEYTVGMILRTTEGSLAPVPCVDNSSSCHRAAKCVTIDVYREIQQAIENVVDHITLADLVERYHQKVPIDYFI